MTIENEIFDMIPRFIPHSWVFKHDEYFYKTNGRFAVRTKKPYTRMLDDYESVPETIKFGVTDIFEKGISELSFDIPSLCDIPTCQRCNGTGFDPRHISVCTDCDGDSVERKHIEIGEGIHVRCYMINIMHKAGIKRIYYTGKSGVFYAKSGDMEFVLMGSVCRECTTKEGTKQ